VTPRADAERKATVEEVIGATICQAIALSRVSVGADPQIVFHIVAAQKSVVKHKKCQHNSTNMHSISNSLVFATYCTYIVYIVLSKQCCGCTCSYSTSGLHFNTCNSSVTYIM
jgi:hypothetical protein